MNVVITGASNGIGRATALVFLKNNYNVIGIDVEASSITHELYTHIIADVRYELPDIPDVKILVNSAGVQDSESGVDIAVNLRGLINVTEKYAFQKHIKAVVNVASTSAHNGAEFPEYVASKGGVLAYTKNVAIRLAERGATCNSVSPGAVYTSMNDHILQNPELTDLVAQQSLLKKWAYASEIGQWIYFIACVNKSMTGQDIIIDNGELSNFKFIW